jgi:phage-related protein (TIGR01555 family)
VSDIASAFSTFVLKGNLAESLSLDGEQLFIRAEVFNNLRNNRGLFMIDKESEDFGNVSAPLGGLDLLQAQAQEHQASVCGIPLVKLLGISPHGLNATAEPELRAFYEEVRSFQESFFRPNLTKVIDFIQLSLFGEVDQEITFKFVPLFSLTEAEEADVRMKNAQSHQVYVDMGVVSPEEVRETVVNDPGSPYVGLDPEDVPDLLEEEQEGGLEPVGGRPDPEAEELVDNGGDDRKEAAE